MSNISLRQRLENAYGSQQVENVKAYHAYLHGRADTVGEFGKIWTVSDEVSWAHAFGRMRGFSQVWYGGVTYYDMQAMQHWISIYEKYPEVGGKDPRPLLEVSVHTLVTDIIEVAEDGLSARGSFLTPGVITSRFNDDGHPYCMILWERYGADFVNEDGEWKYIHEHVCPDLFGDLDCTNWAKDDYEALCREETAKGSEPQGTGTEPPPVADPGPLHTPYSLVQPPQNTVPWPEPYKKMDNNNTYTSFRGLDSRFE